MAYRPCPSPREQPCRRVEPRQSPKPPRAGRAEKGPARAEQGTSGRCEWLTGAPFRQRSTRLPSREAGARENAARLIRLPYRFFRTSIANREAAPALFWEHVGTLPSSTDA